MKDIRVFLNLFRSFISPPDLFRLIALRFQVPPLKPGQSVDTQRSFEVQIVKKIKTRYLPPSFHRLSIDFSPPVCSALSTFSCIGSEITRVTSRSTASSALKSQSLSNARSQGTSLALLALSLPFLALTLTQGLIPCGLKSCARPSRNNKMPLTMTRLHPKVCSSLTFPLRFACPFSFPSHLSLGPRSDGYQTRRALPVHRLRR